DTGWIRDEADALASHQVQEFGFVKEYLDAGFHRGILQIEGFDAHNRTSGRSQEHQGQQCNGQTTKHHGKWVPFRELGESEARDAGEAGWSRRNRWGPGQHGGLTQSPPCRVRLTTMLAAVRYGRKRSPNWRVPP